MHVFQPGIPGHEQQHAQCFPRGYSATHSTKDAGREKQPTGRGFVSEAVRFDAHPDAELQREPIPRNTETVPGTEPTAVSVHGRKQIKKHPSRNRQPHQVRVFFFNPICDQLVEKTTRADKTMHRKRFDLFIGVFEYP